MKHHSRFAAALLATSMLAAPSAFAQDDTLGGSSLYEEDVIIVTATRRAENIQDVPIAVTAVTPEALEKQGVADIQDLSIVAPSFATSAAQIASGSVVLRIRGVGTTSNNIGFESAVGVFIDGAYQSRPGVALGEFVDVERVEVLRGPQGTLFGRNTSAGALNITNVAPDLSEYGGFANFTYGNYDLLNLQAAVNIPIIEDALALRITGAYRERDGYIDLVGPGGADLGESNGADQLLLRGQLGFERPSGFNGRIIVDYNESDAVCCAAIELLQSPLEIGGVFGALGLGARGGQFAPNVASTPTDNSAVRRALDDSIASVSFAPDPSFDQTGITGEFEFPINDSMDLIYIGSYRDYSAFERYDSDFTTLSVFDVDAIDLGIETMTHELRLQGDAMDGRLSWLIGGYYSDEDILQSSRFTLGEDYDGQVGAIFGGAVGPAPLQLFTGVDPSVVSTENIYRQDSESLSVFTHNVFDITDALSLTLGLRYTDESKDGGFSQGEVNNPLCTSALTQIGLGNVPGPLVNGIFGLGCFAFTAPADLPAAAVFPLPRTFDETFEDDELIYTGKLGYEFGNNVSTYASFTHGYKSGGFNLDSTAAVGGADPRFLSETVDAYEIGLKSNLANNRVTFNAAAFIENFENFQVLEFTGAQFTTFNVPKAESKGIELETVMRLTDMITLNGGLTFLDAKYPDDCAGDNTTINVNALCGNSLTNAPDTVGVVGINYENVYNGDYTYFLNAQLRAESDRRTSTQAIVLPATLDGISTAPLLPFDVQRANRKVNLRAGIGPVDESWALELWGTNVFDRRTRGVTFNTVLRDNSRSAFLQTPRQYGVTVRTRF